MTRLVTLIGYFVIAVCALAAEIAARWTRRMATFASAVSLAGSRRPSRLLLQAGWLWLGWHLFVRVDWRG